MKRQVHSTKDIVALVVLTKLTRHFKLSEETASLIVEAGFGTPREIRSASDRELRAVEGIGPSELTEIRSKLDRP